MKRIFINGCRGYLRKKLLLKNYLLKKLLKLLKKENVFGAILDPNRVFNTDEVYFTL